MTELMFSANTSRRNGTCDGRGRKSQTSEAEALKLCRNKNAWRSEGARSNSWVDESTLDEASSSSEVSESPVPRPRLSI